MPLITFIAHDGTSQDVHVESGVSLMQAAVDNGIEGIVAECGGACSCATCHCYIDEAWLSKTGETSEMEDTMLDCVTDPKPNSRLSCQITVRDKLDGLVVRIPESQF